MDDADRAQLVTEREHDAIMERHTSSLRDAPQHRQGADVLCLDCTDVIDGDRLAALPHAIRCYVCQTDYEKRQQQRYT